MRNAGNNIASYLHNRPQEKTVFNSAAKNVAEEFHYKEPSFAVLTPMCFGARNQVCGQDLFRARFLLQSHM